MHFKVKWKGFFKHLSGPAFCASPISVPAGIALHTGCTPSVWGRQEGKLRHSHDSACRYILLYTRNALAYLYRYIHIYLPPTTPVAVAHGRSRAAAPRGTLGCLGIHVLIKRKPLNDRK